MKTNTQRYVKGKRGSIVVGDDNYVYKRVAGSKHGGATKYSNWWLIKNGTHAYGNANPITIRYIQLPYRFIGKRVRIKIEVIDETKEA